MFYKSFWKSILWAIIILILCSISGKEIEKVNIIPFEHLDKLVHAFLYFVLAILLANSFLKFKKSSFKNSSMLFFMVFIISVFYGVLIEFLQYSVFNDRSAELLDILSNTSGAVLGVLIYKPLIKIKLIKKYILSD